MSILNNNKDSTNLSQNPFADPVYVPIIINDETGGCDESQKPYQSIYDANIILESDCNNCNLPTASTLDATCECIDINKIIDENPEPIEAINARDVFYTGESISILGLIKNNNLVQWFINLAIKLDLYQLRSEKDQPNGYPSLDEKGKVPLHELPLTEINRYHNENLVPTTIGGYELGLPATGQDGLNFVQFADKLLFPELVPTFINPSAYMFNNIGNNIVEVNSQQQLILAISYNPGEIKGALRTTPPIIWDENLVQGNRAGAAINYVINGLNAGITNYVTINGFMPANGVNTFSGHLTYGQGPQPISSKNLNYGIPLPAGTSATISTSFLALYKQFFGNVNAFPINSNEVRALSGNNFSNINQFDVAITSTKFALAIPASKNLVTVITQNFETITSSFILSELTTVNDISGSPVNYKVYNFRSDSPLNLTVTIKLS